MDKPTRLPDGKTMYDNLTPEEYALVEATELATALQVESISAAITMVPPGGEYLPIARVPGFTKPVLPELVEGNDMQYSWHVLKDGAKAGYILLEIEWPQDSETRKLAADVTTTVRRLPTMVRDGGNGWLAITGEPKGRFDMDLALVVQMTADPNSTGLALACDWATHLDRVWRGHDDRLEDT